MLKKLISFLICLTMLLSFVPAMAEDVAETTTTEATYVNVAVNKPITAGIYDEDYQLKTNLNDGNDETGVEYYDSEPEKLKSDNSDGQPSSRSDAWYQIDLGEQYLIDNIVLKYTTTTNWATPYSFKIMASNSSDFSDGTAVTLIAIGNEGASGSPLTVQGDGNKYQYVRLQKTEGIYTSYGYAKYTELEVWVDESTIVKPINVALNKPITAGCYDPTWIKPTLLNDGNLDTSVYYGGSATHNADGIPSGKGDAWYQIDLGARYRIENVAMIFGSGYTGCDFKISVSNSPDFSDGTAKVIAVEGETTIVPSPYVANGDGGYYRYVRWERVPASISNNNGYTNFQELEVYAYEDSVILPTNIAVNKPITAGIYQDAGSANPKANLNDGNKDTTVYCGGIDSDNVGGVPSAATDAWFQIDLGARYLIEKVQLWYNHTDATWTVPHNFNIKVANSADFSDAVVVKSVGDEDIDVTTVEDDGVTRNLISVNADGGYYRYVRWERTPGSFSPSGYSDLAELEVYAYPENVQQEQITIGTPRYFPPIRTVNIPYTFENLADDTVITLWAVAKNSDGKVISVNAQNFTDDAASEAGLQLDTVEGASYIQVFAWKGLEPLVTLDAIQIN